MSLTNNEKTGTVNFQQFEVAYKENGHMKKIRKKRVTELREQIIKEVTNYLSNFGQNLSVSESKSRGQISILNINIKPIQIYFYEQKEGLELKVMTKEQTFGGLTQSETLQLLQNQIQLFKSQQDIRTFIQTEKNISVNIEDSLTALLQNSLKICWNFLKQQKHSSFFNPNQLFESQKSHCDSSQTMLIKENLQKIEDQCLETLDKIKEQRRKLELCGICLSTKANTILLPCMHLGTCLECANMVGKCPFCKEIIVDRKVVFK